MSEHEHEISVENEKKVLLIIVITVVTMFFEIFYGYITKSMALLANIYSLYSCKKIRGFR